MTGETIQGVKSNIKNIYIDEDSCYVELDFTVNSTEYKIIRYNKPKSDLKLYVDDVDKSGKGIRESELALAEYLPDLTRELISSVILLGQGLPFKLSSFSPSGRKEVLEKLSKSDFMIDDIRLRLNNRYGNLDNLLREITLKTVHENSKLEMLNKQKSQYEEELNKLNETSTESIESKLKTLEESLVSVNKERQDRVNILKEIETLLTSTQESKFKLLERKQEEVNENQQAYNSKKEEITTKELELKSALKSVSDEYNRLKSIKDVCPTCGQKIPGIIKPDTSVQEQQIDELRQKLSNLDVERGKLLETYNKYSKEIDSMFDSELKDLESKMSQYTSDKRRNEDLSDVAYNDYLHITEDISNIKNESISLLYLL